MKKFWIIFAILSVIGIVIVWLYTRNNKKKEIVYQNTQTEEVGAMDYITGITTGINAMSGLFSKRKQPDSTPIIASTGGSGAVAFVPTPGVKYPSLSDIKRT